MRLRDMAARIRSGARGGLDWMGKKDWLDFVSMRIWSSDIKIVPWAFFYLLFTFSGEIAAKGCDRMEQMELSGRISSRRE